MKKVLNIVVFSFLAVATCGTVVGIGTKGQNIESASAQYSPSKTYTNHDGATYYSGINSSLEGNDLLSALRSLNNTKKQKSVGYSSMGTSSGSSAYIYTDYDPKTVKYDSKGQPYGTKVLSFYSGNSTNSWNREHVWPNSHGGNVVEDDIHMPRPTIPAENGSRGNSFYVEGMKHSYDGWDPKMETFGKEDYRGDSARIIFYCVVASSQLKLLDVSKSQTSNENKDYKMGKLSHLLKWNLQYPVLQREINRNEGAEYLQGNRNPFIDHPEYACKIWGNYDDDCKKICSGVNPDPTPVVKGTLSNPYTPSEAIATSFSGQAYVKGAAYYIKTNGNKASLTLYDIGNMTAQTGINVVDMDLEGKTIVNGDIVTVKATRSTTSTALVAPGFIYSVEKPQSNGGGCGGSIVTSSIILFSSALAGFSLVVIKKNKKKKEENE